MDIEKIEKLIKESIGRCEAVKNDAKKEAAEAETCIGGNVRLQNAIETYTDFAKKQEMLAGLLVDLDQLSEEEAMLAIDAIMHIG